MGRMIELSAEGGSGGQASVPPATFSLSLKLFRYDRSGGLDRDQRIGMAMGHLPGAALEAIDGGRA